MKSVLKKTVVLFILVVTLLGGYFWLNLWCPPWWGRIFYPLRFKNHIAQAASKHHIDPYLISAVIYEESGFNPNSKSKVGACGLMQIMPSTGRWIAQINNRSGYSKHELFEPSCNIELGCWYFSYLLDKYDNQPLALAAYNGGARNVDIWFRNKKDYSTEDAVDNIPYGETRDFVIQVENTKKKYRKIYPDAFK